MEKESKQLGLFDIFCLGLGGAIGSGIFVMMGSGIPLRLVVPSSSLSPSAVCSCSWRISSMWL